MNKITKKIEKNSNIITIFYSKWCAYSIKALELLEKKKIAYKGYIIDKYGIDTVLELLAEDKEKLKFNIEHKTRPIIFYKSKFIGGYTDLVDKINKNIIK